jgi:hypothetical protein
MVRLGLGLCWIAYGLKEKEKAKDLDNTIDMNLNRVEG